MAGTQELSQTNTVPQHKITTYGSESKSNTRYLNKTQKHSRTIFSFMYKN